MKIGEMNFHQFSEALRGFLIHPPKNFRHFPIPLKQGDESDFFENRTPPPATVER